MLTLIAGTDVDLPGPAVLPVGAEMRPCRPSSAEALGRLSFAAYEPGTACDTPAEPVGELWPAGSLLIERGVDPIAAIPTVRRAPGTGRRTARSRSNSLPLARLVVRD